MARQRRNAPVALLAGALLGAGVMLLALGWNYTFFQDTWAYLLDRRDFSADAFLVPHNEHLVVIPVAIEKLLVAVFGMTTALPEFIVMTAILLTGGALLFVYARRRTGPWPALVAAVLLLFLGAAWPVLLWPFEMSLAGSTVAGLAMLLLLDRDDRPGDRWASLLLALSIGFGSVGISFALAALVDVFQKRKRRGWRRLWVPGVPLLLYTAWYLGWGHDAEHHLTLHNVLHSPAYTFEGFASVVGALAGLSTMTPETLAQPEWGQPLLIALIGLAIYLRRGRGIPSTFWPVAVAAVSYWLLAAFNFIPGREAVTSRYVYSGAVFVLLIAAELLRGAQPSRRALWIGAALTAVAVLPNLAQLGEGATWLEKQSVLTRADTGALNIARRTVPSSFSLTPDIAGTGSLFIVEAGKYFAAVDEHGSPGYSPSELQDAPEEGRRWADVVLSQALPLSTETQPGSYAAATPENCVVVEPGAAPPQGVELSPGVSRIEVAPGPEAPIKLRRFAVEQFPVPLQSAAGESTTRLWIPRDHAPQPWYLQVEAAQPVRVCR